MTTTATIKAKGCQSTGITEELAKRLHDQLGRKVLAVVELVAENRSENRDGDEKVQLSVLTIEPAPNSDTEDHLRNLARSFHYERALADGDPPLFDNEGTEPNVTDVLAAGQRWEPHPYLASTLSTDDNAICDICGQVEATPVHADRTGLPDPFTIVTDADLDTAEEDDEQEAPEEDEAGQVDESEYTWNDEDRQ